jgi:uncharacterized protein YjlB
MIEPRRIYLKTDDWIPNNPRRPVLIYRNAADFDLPDIGTTLEGMFERNGWRSLGRGNIHRDFHYHSTAHEVIGIASGSAILGIGGKHSPRLAVDAGDVLVLPAGTGHARIRDSSDFSVVTACPDGQEPDFCREMASLEIVSAITDLPYPPSDPVVGGRPR